MDSSVGRILAAGWMVEERRRRATGPRTTSEPRPFLTISRQYGCGGFALALRVQALLEQEGAQWPVYSKEIVQQIATELETTAELVQRERRSGNDPVVEFVRSMSPAGSFSGYEVRRRTAEAIRDLACEGNTIIVGLGGAAVTRDIPHGLAVRLEAPMDWRVKQVALRQGIDEHLARARLDAVERGREYLHRLYVRRFPRAPAFHLTFDASVFDLEDIAQDVVRLLARMRSPPLLATSAVAPGARVGAPTT